MSRKNTRSRAVMLSKRANVFYLEKSRVVKDGDRVLFMTNTGAGISQFFNLPDKNTAFVLLGRGTSITDGAVRMLTESGVMLGFCGSGGSPLFSATDIMFMPGVDEYRPTNFMHAWMRMWMDESTRLDLAKLFLVKRIELTKRFWGKQGLSLPVALSGDFSRSVESAKDTQALLLAEAAWAKALYRILAQNTSIHFSRKPGEGRKDDAAARVNSYLDHGNYLAYGFAATALHGLGIPFSLPILHGKTRRGGLVFDVADLVKDGGVMPLAFFQGQSVKSSDKSFRAAVIEFFHSNEILDLLMTFVSDLCEKIE